MSRVGAFVGFSRLRPAIGTLLKAQIIKLLLTTAIGTFLGFMLGYLGECAGST